MKVLIVDDSKMMRGLHARSLRQIGYQLDIVEAASAEEALDAFSEDLDLIIVDWSLPGLSGVEFTRLARSREQAAGTRRIPFLMITSHSAAQQVYEARAAGVDLVLAKPATTEMIARTLDVLLNPRL